MFSSKEQYIHDLSIHAARINAFGQGQVITQQDNTFRFHDRVEGGVKNAPSRVAVVKEDHVEDNGQPISLPRFYAELMTRDWSLSGIELQLPRRTSHR